MKFKYYFQKDFQTADAHELEKLRTHYYRSRKEEVMETVKNMLSEMKCKINSVDDERGEIVFDNINYNGTATVIAVNFSEIAVDLTVYGMNILPTAYGMKVIEKFYQYLDSRLRLKGIGLYK